MTGISMKERIRVAVGRRLLKFFWDELSLSLIFTALIPVVTYIAFRQDQGNRWVIVVAGAAAFATALAAHENVQMRRAMAYPRIEITWRQRSDDSITILRNIGVGTAYLTDLRVEARYQDGATERGETLQPPLILPPSEAVHFEFGNGQTTGRAYRGFMDLRVTARLHNVFGKRLLAVDQTFTDAEMWRSDEGERLGIWMHENREGSFVP